VRLWVALWVAFSLTQHLSLRGLLCSDSQVWFVHPVASHTTSLYSEVTAEDRCHDNQMTSERSPTQPTEITSHGSHYEHQIPSQHKAKLRWAVTARLVDTWHSGSWLCSRKIPHCLDTPWQLWSVNLSHFYTLPRTQLLKEGRNSWILKWSLLNVYTNETL